MKSFDRNLFDKQIENVLNNQHGNFSERSDEVLDDIHVMMKEKWQLDYST